MHRPTAQPLTCTLSLKSFSKSAFAKCGTMARVSARYRPKDGSPATLPACDTHVHASLHFGGLDV